jgi:protein TonB
MSSTVQILESGRSRLGRWAAAALVVCALHAGGAALALMYWQEAEDADDPAGALTVDMSLLPAPTPVNSPDNVAYGPEQQQATLTQEAAKPVVEEEVKDIPLLEPSPAPEPEVALPKPQPEEKEKPKEQEDPQEATPQEEMPQQDADIPVTTAPPRVEAQPAPSGGPAPAMSASHARAKASWENALSRQLNRHKRVPGTALGRRGYWEAVVAFSVDRSGQLISSELRKSTGVPALDREALEWLQRASPFPPPPDIPGIELYFTQSIKFGVK